jgi:hypothetical protein
MIVSSAIMPRSHFQREERWMTAYLICLALLGLIAIAVWDGLA